MNLNTNYLITFKKLIEVQSFTKTAKLLNMTQPGVSQHIKFLETYFDTPLLKKHGKSFELTRHGEKVLAYTKKIFNDHDQFLNSFNEDEPFMGTCRFSSPGSFGIKMYDFLLKYNQKYPKLSINFFYSPNITVEKDLLAGTIDLGFMSTPPKDPSLESKIIDQEKLCLVAPAKLKNTSFQSLKELGFIYHPDGVEMGHQILTLNFPKEYRGMDKIKVSGGTNQITRILEPVALGVGFTVLPEFACRAFKKQKSIQYIPLKKEIKNEIYVVYKKYKPLAIRFENILSAFEATKT